MKHVIASAIFLIVSMSSVLACRASYWFAAPDYIAPYTCPNTNTTNRLYKESYWSVKYPQQTGFTNVLSSGSGKCGVESPMLAPFLHPRGSRQPLETSS
jgi:hypothetical protein